MPVPSSAQCSGGNVLALLAALGPFRVRGTQILAAHGITDVRAEGWYSLGAFAAALHEIGERMGPATLFQVGARIPETIVMPPGIEGFAAVCEAFGQAFAMNHRGAGNGGITVELTGAESAIIVSRTPYPCDFDRGVIQGFFRTLLGRSAVAAHDDTKPCKKAGGESCTHVVRAGGTAGPR